MRASSSASGVLAGMFGLGAGWANVPALNLVMGVPLTYPPTPLRGVLASDFLTPNKSVTWTFPASLGARLDAWARQEVVRWNRPSRVKAASS